MLIVLTLFMEPFQIHSVFMWIWRRKEAFLWLGAIIFLACSNPEHHHYTLCPFNNAGIEFCPGCGLGRSIGYIFRLDFESSVMAHPLGIPAVILLLSRSFRVFRRTTSLELTTI